MIIPSGGCDAMHMAAKFEVLRRDLRIAEEHLGLARGERDEAKAELQKVIARLHEMTSERDTLAKRAAHLEAEKAVLIRFVKDSCEACDLCRHAATMADDRCEGSCCECGIEAVCVCGACKGASNFEFVGVEEKT